MSVVGEAVVRGRGVGVGDAEATARELDDLARTQTWAARLQF